MAALPQGQTGKYPLSAATTSDDPAHRALGTRAAGPNGHNTATRSLKRVLQRNGTGLFGISYWGMENYSQVFM